MNKEVIVKFETNGGNIIPQETIKYGFLIVVPEPKKIGYEFVCWCKDETLKEVFDPNKIIEENITLYAKWDNYAPKKFINDISVYTNLSNVVKDYQEIYNHNNKVEEEVIDRKEKARIDKSNYVHKLDDEFNACNEEYKQKAIFLNKKIEECEKLKIKMEKSVSKKGEEKSIKIINLYNETKKEEEKAQAEYDNLISKLDDINNKYEEFVSKNK